MVTRQCDHLNASFLLFDPIFPAQRFAHHLCPACAAGPEPEADDRLIDQHTQPVDALGSPLFCFLQEQRVGTVSYTHLDVYKRQVLRYFRNCFL